MKSTDFSGKKCGIRYEKEYLERFSDSLIFYIDGKIKFERHFHGEGACLVFKTWATMNDDGDIIYKKPFAREVVEADLPKKLTKVDGNILYFDENYRKWSNVYEFKKDPASGYPPIKLLFIKLFKAIPMG
ncbi:MAG: hypothetical protein R3Y12_01265 [Clostridia bacterium]